MLAASDALKAFVANYATESACRVDLYTLTLADATTYYFHDAADPWPGPPILSRTDYIPVNGINYAKGPGIARSALSVEIGTAVPTLDWVVYPKGAADSAGPADTIKGVTWQQAARRRLFDGATVKLETLIMPTWGDASLGPVTRFLGLVGEIEASVAECRIRCNAELIRLNQQMPRNLWQPGCNNTLYDAGCALSKAAFGVPGAVTGAATLTTVPWSIGTAAGYFDLGTLEFTSGACNGSKRTIKAWDGATLTLLRPLDAAPATGDTFVAFPGCDHSRGPGGCGKFNNLAHFRGFPFVPQPSTVL